MNREKITFIVSVMVMAALIFTPSCATQKKLQRLRNGETPQVQLTLGNQPDYLPKVDERSNVTRDTLKVKDDDGRELIVMKAIKDEESGEMVATEEIQAAKVTARFRNVAERNGRVDLAFQVIVPPIHEGQPLATPVLSGHVHAGGQRAS